MKFAHSPSAMIPDFGDCRELSAERGALRAASHKLLCSWEAVVSAVSLVETRLSVAPLFLFLLTDLSQRG